MTLGYLWQERKRHPFGSHAWLKSWAKRVYNAPALLRLCWMRLRLRRHGADIGFLSVVDIPVGARMKNLHVGNHTFIAKAYIALNAPLTIGNYVLVNQDVTILTATHGLDDPRWRAICKEVRIDDYAWIATGAMLMPGTHIGRGAVVGAGAVVRGEVPPYAVVIGNPAKATSKRRIEKLEYSPVAFLAPYEAWLEPGTHVGVGK